MLMLDAFKCNLAWDARSVIHVMNSELGVVSGGIIFQLQVIGV
jgi:hypothetical protein